MDEETRALEREAVQGDGRAVEALTLERLRSASGTVLAWPMDAQSKAGPILPPMPGCTQAALPLPGSVVPVQCWVVAPGTPDDVVLARTVTPAGSPVLVVDLGTSRTVDLSDPKPRDWHAGAGWDFDAERTWDPVRGEVRVATWIRGHVGRHDPPPPSPPPTPVAHSGLMRLTPVMTVPYRVTEVPLWCRSVLPAGSQPYTAVRFFDGSPHHPDGSVCTPADLGPTPWFRGCLPRGFHFHWYGVSIHVDADAAQEDVATLARATLEVRHGTRAEPLARLASILEAPRSSSTATDGTLVLTGGQPWVMSVTVAGRPREVEELESFSLLLHLYPATAMTRRTGVTCVLHGALRVPQVG